MGSRAEDVGAQVVAGDAGRGFDGQNPIRRDTARCPPVGNRALPNTERPRKADNAASPVD